jgi:hypothetical protein
VSTYKDCRGCLEKLAVWVRPRVLLTEGANSRYRCQISFAIRESRIANRGMNLKPQDVVVALKLCAYPGERPAMSIVASDLGLSPSEVHGAIKRLRSSRLLHGPALKDKPNISGPKNFWCTV